MKPILVELWSETKASPRWNHESAFFSTSKWTPCVIMSLKPPVAGWTKPSLLKSMSSDNAKLYQPVVSLNKWSTESALHSLLLCGILAREIGLCKLYAGVWRILCVPLTLGVQSLLYIIILIYLSLSSTPLACLTTWSIKKCSSPFDWFTCVWSISIELPSRWKWEKFGHHTSLSRILFVCLGLLGMTSTLLSYFAGAVDFFYQPQIGERPTGPQSLEVWVTFC